jgi:hypothetical protein
VLYAVETSRAIFRDAERVADEDEQKKIAEWAIRSQSLERLKAMWTLAKADLALSPEELDTAPMLLNVENGTIDLRTGSLRPHRAEDLITKLAPVEFDVTAEAPTFEGFLKQVLVEDELIAFVQRFLGYSLTGATEERALAVLHGVGKNGKSTLVELFQDLLGDYSTVAHPDTLMKQRFSDSTAQYQLAELKGARFVGVSETKRGVELEEATVKQITGSDTISARALRQAVHLPASVQALALDEPQARDPRRLRGDLGSDALDPVHAAIRGRQGRRPEGAGEAPQRAAGRAGVGRARLPRLGAERHRLGGSGGSRDGRLPFGDGRYREVLRGRVRVRSREACGEEGAFRGVRGVVSGERRRDTFAEYVLPGDV